MSKKQRLFIHFSIAYLILTLAILVIEDNRWGDSSFTLEEMARWSSYANHNNNGTALAYDGDADTKWTTLDPMVQGLYFQVDMGSPHRITKVMLYSGPNKMESPKGYLIETSLDGEAWEISASGWNGPARLFVRFRPVEARFVRITQTLMEPTNPWSIHELRIFRNDPPFILPDGIRELLILFALAVLIALIWLFHVSYFKAEPKDALENVLSAAIIFLFILLLIVSATGGLYLQLFGRSARLMRYDLLAYMIASLWLWRIVRQRRRKISSMIGNHPLLFFLAFFLGYYFLWMLFLKDKEMKVGGNFHLFFEKVRGFLGG